MLQLMRKNCSHIYTPLSTARYSSIQLSKLEQCRVKKIAYGLNTAAQDLNPGSQESEALPLSHCDLLYRHKCTDHWRQQRDYSDTNNPREEQEDDNCVHVVTVGSKQAVTGGHIDPTSLHLVTRPEITTMRHGASESRHVNPEFAKACVLSRRKLKSLDGVNPLTPTVNGREK